MNRTKIKICGITQVETAKAFIDLSIDAIGLVFYEKSPRYVSNAQANLIINTLPPFVNRVGLFVNASADFINQTIAKVPLDTLQFHGDETPKECIQYNLPFIKACRVASDTNIAQLTQDYHQACGLLLDADHLTDFGGTGQTFDWSLIPRDLSLPIILAGGLTPDNVAQAIKTVKPYGVDVSSGVEQQKGIKNLTKIKQFIQQTQQN